MRRGFIGVATVAVIVAACSTGTGSMRSGSAALPSASAAAAPTASAASDQAAAALTAYTAFLAAPTRSYRLTMQTDVDLGTDAMSLESVVLVSGGDFQVDSSGTYTAADGTSTAMPAGSLGQLAGRAWLPDGSGGTKTGTFEAEVVTELTDPLHFLDDPAGQLRLVHATDAGLEFELVHPVQYVASNGDPSRPQTVNALTLVLRPDGTPVSATWSETSSDRSQGGTSKATWDRIGAQLTIQPPK